MIRPRGGTRGAGGPIRDYSVWTQKLRKFPHVTRVMPYVETEMIVQSDFRTLGAVIWGESLADLARLKAENGLTSGTLPTSNGKLPQIILGTELAHRLGVSPGKKVKIISPIEKSGPMGLVPRAQTFEVVGTYTSGHYEFDLQYIFMPIEDAQDLLKWGDAVSGWHVWVDKLSRSESVARNLSGLLPLSWEPQSWEIFNSALFQSLKLEQYAMFSILSFAVVIAVMNIVITLMMHVNHKRRNIGILRALGASRRQIGRIFMWQGALLGAVGLSLGAVLTVIFIVYIRYFSTIELPDIYYDRSIPVEIRPISLLTIYLVAIGLIYLGTLYPSQKAARVDPIDAIRE
jgi:lipoprotein-releasing system permease protein